MDAVFTAAIPITIITLDIHLRLLPLSSVYTENLLCMHMHKLYIYREEYVSAGLFSLCFSPSFFSVNESRGVREGEERVFVKCVRVQCMYRQTSRERDKKSLTLLLLLPFSEMKGMS